MNRDEKNEKSMHDDWNLWWKLEKRLIALWSHVEWRRGQSDEETLCISELSWFDENEMLRRNCLKSLKFKIWIRCQNEFTWLR